MKITEIKDIRRNWLTRGELPSKSTELVMGSELFKSWQRCLYAGLDPNAKNVASNILSGEILKIRLEHRQELISLAEPTMNYLHHLMSRIGGVVLLSDHQGVIISSVGDPEFLTKADRVLLKTGASWSERHRGTNAIGTALVEGSTVTVNGLEHFYEVNGFLSCVAAPIYFPDGAVAGVLDITTEKSSYHPHTIGLVTAAVHGLERQLFQRRQQDYYLTIKVHPSPEGLGSMAEGVLGVREDGLILGGNRVGLGFLKVNFLDVGHTKFQDVVNISLQSLFDKAKSTMNSTIELSMVGDKKIYVQLALTRSSKIEEVIKDAAVVDVVAPAPIVETSKNLKELSILAIKKTLSELNGNISLTAKRLGISRNTLYRYLRDGS